MGKHIYNSETQYPKGTPFTYLISWSELNISYYGVKYKKNCHPDDLWNIYFTSSKSLKKFRKLNGEPDIIKIDFVYDTAKEARISEYEYIKDNNCVKNPKWLNLANGGEEFYIEKHSEETKKKISDSLKGRPTVGTPCSEETKQKLSEINKGKTLSDETKQKMSDASKGKPKSEEHCKHISDAQRGKSLSDEQKQNISNGLSGRTLSDEHKQNISKGMTGRLVSEETIQKMSNSKKGRIWIYKDSVEKIVTLEDAENIYYPQGFIKGKIKKLL